MTYNRHYCYRIDFADGFVYFGVRTCRCPIAADSYMGSPTAHKAKWLTDTPRVKTIVSVHVTRQLANEAEAKLISDFWAVSKELSLNAAIGGAKFHMQGIKLSYKTLAKMSKPKSAEHRASMSIAQKGRQHTAEAKAKISAARTGKPGKPCAVETKAKLSKLLKGRKRKPFTSEHIANMSKPQRPRSASHSIVRISQVHGGTLTVLLTKD